ncbi:MAG: DNA repair protein RecO [Betaproteobacteria bacterium CG2_30_59_46]|nr:MAG: DNA repair protein RecO [Betaproteobacteria bacterium CG2_30_59_46]PIQ12811.1 MAG: DNA repair protein RecO [Hydrogenophilales bacterium CG18_big_fil_WC_8_21_14_2_50_58_12]PIY00071.1 MAG: DNA repair protein RecO [Hydrogenophilales bacterium CG_4_10_14_3_um_filter_58_23]PJB06578.1 MAG: DNA repair protein RecO [Hydrogenophilales bacterium CG_4_9_14_3_um_filter_59_35]
MAREHNARQGDQPGYVLHTYPYRETSLIVEVFSRDFGRLPLMARGARRPKSAVRGLLLSFQPLSLSWFGKAELRTLHSAEWQGGQPLLQGTALICGFYLNELLLKLLHRDDPHEQLFLYYQETLQELARRTDYAAVLRRFEINLLKELGYALTLEHDADSGAAIEPDAPYRYVFECGPVRQNNGQNGVELWGKTLLDMAANDYGDPVTLQQSKALMRALINHYLGEGTLHTRQILKDLLEL